MSSNYFSKLFDKVGWVRGMKFYRGEWGAYLWSLQSHLAFKPSETEVWRSPTNGASVKIINVIVGSLGIYPPVVPVVDIGPDLSPATNFPGEVDWNETKMFSADISNVFYIIAIPVIRIEPRNAVSCAGGSNIEYSVTGSNIPAGVGWSLIPNLSGSGGAAIQTTADWSQAQVIPGNIATNYKVRATAMHNVNFYDEVDLTVVKVDIVQTSEVGYVYYPNCVGFNLTTGRSMNVFWKISPDLGTNGAQFSARPRWTGTGTNVWSGTNVWVYSGPVSNNYTIRAAAIEDTNCTDTAVLEVLQPDFLDFNWLETTNEALHHTSAYQTNALVLRRADKFKVEAKLSKGYTNAYYDVWFQAVHNFDGSPTTNDVPEVATDLGATNWYCKLLSVSNNADETKTVQMEINIPSTNCPIGAYQWRAVVSPKAAANLVLDTTNFPGQVIILFNPWSANDSVYMTNDNERTEYVMETMGRMWQGEHTNKSDIVWVFAQFDNSSLATLLYSLNGDIGPTVPALDSDDRADPIKVSRHLSLACNNADGDGILQGNWSTNLADYADGTYPSIWTGSDQILQQYGISHNTVKYGQCWVFGGLLTSLLRSAGIPARPITNYDSVHDKNGNKIMDYDYELVAGTWTNTYSDSIWNYHVWCDALMKRPDRPAYDGWQAVDGTPQETSGGFYQCGPAPVSAVKDDAGGDYDVNFVYAEVSAITRIRYNFSGTWYTMTNIVGEVGHDISTKVVGGNIRNDITSSYK